MTPACPSPEAGASIRPMVTADDLRAAIAANPDASAEVICRAAGASKQAVYKRPNLRAILQAHFAARPRTTDSAGRTTQHAVALAHDVLAWLDARAAERAERTGTRPNRSAVAREVVATALRHQLPAPAPAVRGGVKVRLDLGDAHAALAGRLGTEDPELVAGVVRAILTRASTKSTSAPPEKG